MVAEYLAGYKYNEQFGGADSYYGRGTHTLQRLDNLSFWQYNRHIH